MKASMPHNLRRLTATGAAVLAVLAAGLNAPTAIAQENESLQAPPIRVDVIHGSQTVSDVVFIKVARFRYGHERIWNGIHTSFTNNYWMTSSTDPSWNHPKGTKLVRHDTTPSKDIARTSAKASFHTDFAWCNALPNEQDFTLYTHFTSAPNGDHGVSFTQSKICPGVHMSTEEKVDTIRAAWK